MAKKTRNPDSPVAFTWKGVWEQGIEAWQEFFGGESGGPLPTRDLTEDDVAGLTELQAMHLDSPAGRRLYEGNRAGDDAAPSESEQPASGEAASGGAVPPEGTGIAAAPDQPGDSLPDPGV